jgi:hypothetical protein
MFPFAERHLIAIAMAFASARRLVTDESNTARSIVPDPIPHGVACDSDLASLPGQPGAGS